MYKSAFQENYMQALTQPAAEYRKALNAYGRGEISDEELERAKKVQQLKLEQYSKASDITNPIKSIAKGSVGGAVGGAISANLLNNLVANVNSPLQNISANRRRSGKTPFKSRISNGSVGLAGALIGAGIGGIGGGLLHGRKQIKKFDKLVAKENRKEEHDRKKGNNDMNRTASELVDVIYKQAAEQDDNVPSIGRYAKKGAIIGGSIGGGLNLATQLATASALREGINDFNNFMPESTIKIKAPTMGNRLGTLALATGLWGGAGAGIGALVGNSKKKNYLKQKAEDERTKLLIEAMKNNNS